MKSVYNSVLRFAKSNRECLEGKKKGMVAHPRVLTQRTPVLRSGDILSLLCALLSAAFFSSGFLFGAAFLCSCHMCFSFR